MSKFKADTQDAMVALEKVEQLPSSLGEDLSDEHKAQLLLYLVSGYQNCWLY